MFGDTSLIFFSSFAETPSVTVTQLAPRGPATRAAVSASQLSPESAVTGLWELWPCRHSGQHEKSLSVEKGHLTNVHHLCPVLCPQKLSSLKKTAEPPSFPGPHAFAGGPLPLFTRGAGPQGVSWPADSESQVLPYGVACDNEVT